MVEPYLKKGQSVYIEGRLKTRSWEDKDGQTRYTTEIICDSLEMLGKKSSEGVAEQPNPSIATPSTEDDLPF